MIGGTTFIKDNNIKQDFVHNQITLLGNKCTVPATQREALLPVADGINTILNILHTIPNIHNMQNMHMQNMHNNDTHKTCKMQNMHTMKAPAVPAYDDSAVIKV